MRFDSQALNQLDTRYRAHLINGLSGFKSANLIGTVDGNGQTNLSIVSSVVHLGAHPPLIGMVIRPCSASGRAVARHSFENLLETKVFTVNQVSSKFYQAAHQTSARYDKSQSEFEQVGLTAEYLDNFAAPFVAQSELKYGVRLVEVNHIKANNTEFVIGEIVLLHINDKAIKADGFVDIQTLDTVAVSGLDSYHSTTRLERLSYAKPDKPTTPINLDGTFSENKS